MVEPHDEATGRNWTIAIVLSLATMILGAALLFFQARRAASDPTVAWIFTMLIVLGGLVLAASALGRWFTKE